MVLLNVSGKSRLCIAVCMLALLMFFIPVHARASMTLKQMQLLKGASYLDMMVDQLFLKCGLPSTIMDTEPVISGRQSLGWLGVTMQLSAMDWEIVYGLEQPKQTGAAGWHNGGKSGSGCMWELSELLLHAKGHVGFVTVTKKTQGFGYITTYREPTSLFKAHKVIAVKARLGGGFPASELVRRYGQVDDVVKQSGNKVDFRYWVVSLSNNRPESLYAVDFEVKDGTCDGYIISTRAVDFVQQRFELLLRNWERDYVQD